MQKPCACGGTVRITGPMSSWPPQMLRHVRAEPHWSRSDVPKPRVYEEHLDDLLAGAADGRAA